MQRGERGGRKHGGTIMLENGYVCDRLDYCAPTDPRHQHQAGEQTAKKKEITGSDEEE
jgi:hypothetical protein|tara:strand:- start:88 stop:261 length:174 start_codon:yes stop_codon:yes gene_type:complete